MDSVYSEIDICNSDNSNIDSLIQKYNESKLDSVTVSESAFYSTSKTNNTIKNEINCKLCNTYTDGYIILQCNHIFHIKCLAERQSDELYNYKKIDDMFFQAMKCPTCNKNILQEELMYLHNKYVKVTNDLIGCHEKTLNTLDQQLKILQEEIRSSYDYKHKLECDKEKSKSLVKTLITMID